MFKIKCRNSWLIWKQESHKKFELLRDIYLYFFAQNTKILNWEVLGDSVILKRVLARFEWKMQILHISHKLANFVQNTEALN